MSQWHSSYGDKLEILLYPSDEFGGQELPEAQIPAFVEGKGLPTSGGGCTLMSKVNVNGEQADPVFQLAKATFPGDVKWKCASALSLRGAFCAALYNLICAACMQCCFSPRFSPWLYD